MDLAAASLAAIRLTSEPTLRAFDLQTAINIEQVRASGVVEGYYTRQQGGLRFYAELRNEKTEKLETSWVLTVPGPDDVLKVGDFLAAKLGTRLLPAPTRNVTALKEYAEGLSEGDSDAAAQYFRNSMEADSGFGAPAISLMETLVRQRKAEEAEALYRQASGRNLPPYVRAQLELLRANLQGDAAARLDALRRLAGFIPADTDIPNMIGDIEWNRRNITEAARWFRKAVTLEPDFVPGWNLLAYAQAYQGNFSEAVRSLDRYRQISPGDPNASDSIGEVNFLMGNFREAEQAFLAANRKDPNFLDGAPLLKSAFARLFAGGVEGALADFGLYADYRRSRRDDLIEIRGAEFRYLCGQRKEAAEQMEKLTRAPSPDTVALAASELTVWALAEGDRSGAASWTKLAEKNARSPQARVTVLLVGFVAQPPAPAAEWISRVGQFFPGGVPDAVKSMALGYALVLDGHFREALPIWREIVRNQPPGSDGLSRAILGWCQWESGSLDEAKQSLSVYPLPGPEGISPFLPLVIPRFLGLRATLAEKAGNSGEATRAREIFHRLGGDSRNDEPASTGERQAAG